jgi:hypothetical protein
VELPLALPIIFAGIRIAAVSAISLATIAAFIGAGGIGELLFEGMSSQRDDKIVAGAFAASMMAIGTEVLLRQIEKGASPGISGEFKTLGEHLLDGLAYLRKHPDWIALAGAALLLVGFFGMTWVEPYANEENIAENETNRTVLDDANLLKMTGYDLSRLDSNAPVKLSLQFLPWLAGVAGLVALLNASVWQGPRAAAEVLLLCGILAIFPLLHIYYETQSAIGELGRFSEFFRVVRGEINALIDGRVPVNPAELDLEGGFTMAVIGTVLMLAGALLKSMWYRQRDLERKERKA